MNSHTSSIGDLSKQIPIKDDIVLYVSETGSDETGYGTETNPYRQIQTAIDACDTLGLRANIVIHVLSGTYAGFFVKNKDVDIIIHGNIIVVALDSTAPAIQATKYARLSISANVEDTYTISISSATVGMFASDFSYFVISRSVKLVKFAIITEYAVEATLSSKITLNADFQIVSSCTMSILFASMRGSTLEMNYDKSSGIIPSSTSQTYAFYTSEMGKIVVQYVTIPSTVSYGLFAISGGQIYYSNITNRSTKPIYTSSGGRCYTNAQASEGSY